MLICLLTLALPAAAAAAPADLDRSFGGDGIVDAKQRLSDDYQYQSGTGMAVGPRNEVFVLFEAVNCGVSCTGDLFVSRFWPDGSRDRSFGEGGAARVFAAGYEGGGSAIALDRRGRPVVAWGAGDRLVVARLTRGGGIDSSFGINGAVAANGGEALMSVDLAVGPDGGMTALGRWIGIRAPAAYATEMLVVRYLADGRPDPGFGRSGLARLTLEQGGHAQLMALQPGGQIVTAGSSYPEGPLIARIAKNGALDPNLGPLLGNAFARLPRQPRNAPTSVGALIPRGNGSLDVLGGAEGGRGYMARLLPSGKPDLRFASGGAKLLALPVHAAVAEKNGIVFGVGTAFEGGSAVAFRLRRDGGLDRTFGGGIGASFDRGRSGRGAIVGIGPNRGPVIFDPGLQGCREYCPPEPRLWRFVGGTSGARCLGRKATIVGTRRADRLTGTPHRDVIAGLGGDDTIVGRAGNDLICGGDGHDTLAGSAGRDRLRQ